jgi:hypothetical protein
VGVDNLLEVNVAGVSPENVLVEFEGAGSIEHDRMGPAFYVVRTTAFGKCRITVKVKEGTVTKFVDQKEFRIKTDTGSFCQRWRKTAWRKGRGRKTSEGRWGCKCFGKL